VYCHIRVKGYLDASWQPWFAPLQIRYEPAGTTVLSGALPDQPALYGVLLKIDRLGLTLLALESDDAPYKEKAMQTVTSHDGTTIAFDKTGKGPAVILVGAALQYRAFDQGLAQLADLLAPHFSVFHYDRRGRGDSTNTPPYAVEREIEDIEALIDEAGGSAFVYGISSGAALAIEAAIALGGKVKKLAIYEVPYNDDESARQAWKEYTRQLGELLAADRHGDAVALFMRYVGATADQVEGIRQAPVWPLFEAVAPTLAYDHIAILGDDAAVPTERAARVAVPTLIMDGGVSYPFMHVTALALANAIPDAQHRTLEGQTHEVDPAALAPILVEFFNG
jgi:pimeloyl-ACP methyl ester carboxylesterase